MRLTSGTMDAVSPHGKGFGIFRIVLSIRLGAIDLAELRFAFSPLWECVAAFRLVRAPEHGTLHAPWVDAMQPVIADGEWTLLDQVLRPPSGVIPDFAAPPPSRSLGHFDEEVAALAAVSPSVVRDEVRVAWRGDVPELIRRRLSHPKALLRDLATDLKRFWAVAVAPVWPRVSLRLNAEVMFRSRVLALDGPAAVLRGLHRDVRYQPTARGGTLRIKSVDTADRAADGAGLLLVPSVFSWPHAYAIARRPWRPTLAYPARGLADIWNRTPPVSSGEMMAALFGRARAGLLTRLVLPRTTRELSHMLDLSPATVSGHLRELTAVGVTRRLRLGQHVYYSLTEPAAAMLQTLSSAPSRDVS